MKHNLRRLDAFVKTRPDVQQKSVIGGLITVVASSAAALLFVGQIVFYCLGNTHHSLHLSRSTSVPLLPIPGANNIAHRLLENAGKISVSIHVTFPHLACRHLDVIHDGASLSTGELDKIHGKHSLIFRQPTNTELMRMGEEKIMGKKSMRGCTVEGHLRPYVVAGVLSVGMSRTAWAEATTLLSLIMRGDNSDATRSTLNNFNASHYIHNIQFGNSFPLAADKPLEHRLHHMENEYGGLAVEHVQVKLVPTVYQRFLFSADTYQASVVKHTVQPQTLVSKGVPYFPGLVIAYDFTPLAVHHSGGRDNILIFLSSLISIVGGVFVTVGLLTSCLLHSANAVVSKKID